MVRTMTTTTRTTMKTIRLPSNLVENLQNARVGTYLYTLAGWKRTYAGCFPPLLLLMLLLIQREIRASPIQLRVDYHPFTGTPFAVACRSLGGDVQVEHKEGDNKHELTASRCALCRDGWRKSSASFFCSNSHFVRLEDEKPGCSYYRRTMTTVTMAATDVGHHGNVEKMRWSFKCI